MFESDAAWGQIIGTRDYQQDTAAVVSWPNGFQLLILADGMGGNIGGSEASSIVIEEFKASFQNDNEQDIRERLWNALKSVNIAIRQFIEANPDFEGMGSTIIAAAFDGKSFQFISVGDSPLWLYRSGELLRLNENHSMASVFEDKVAQGSMSAREAAESPARSALLSAILGENIDRVDSPELPVEAKEGDIFLLASDGVESCQINQIEESLAVRNKSAEDIVQKILSEVEATRRNSQDNATIISLCIKRVETEVKTVRPSVLKKI